MVRVCDGERRREEGEMWNCEKVWGWWCLKGSSAMKEQKEEEDAAIIVTVHAASLTGAMAARLHEAEGDDDRN